MRLYYLYNFIRLIILIVSINDRFTLGDDDDDDDDDDNKPKCIGETGHFGEASIRHSDK